MKTAVSIPDDVFERAETIAAERKLSRSALYAEALRALIKQIDDARITAEINAALKENGQIEPDRAMRESTRRRWKREFERDGGTW